MATRTVTELDIILSGTAPILALPTSPRGSEEAPPANKSGNDAPPAEHLSKGQTILVVGQLLSVQLITSFCNGVVVIGLPSITSTLDIPANLQLWPTSVFYLTTGSCLMMAGTIADVVGTRPMMLTACTLLMASSLGCSLSRTAGELIAFRALQGITSAMAVPASVSVISTSIEEGRRRNLGFACFGFAGPLGFLVGLVLGGVFTESKVGWRSAFYFDTALAFAMTVIGFLVLPGNSFPRPVNMIERRLASEIDWVGASISCAGVGVMSYVLAVLSSNVDNIRKAENIVLLIISVSCLPAFVFWMDYRVKHDRPALIPNMLWRKTSFSAICVMIMFTSAVSNSMEVYGSLFFQQVQQLSPVQASLRILPALVMAVATNLFTGYVVNRISIIRLILVASALSTVSPIIMAVIDPSWMYWRAAFVAQVLQPLCPDVLYTVGLLIVSAVFPSHTQALSGAVFETASQLGTSIGLTITSVIASSRTESSRYSDKTSPSALMVGYRTVFWALFAWTVFVWITGAAGLRRVGVLGAKRD